jgi:hypothetical protein
MDTPTVSFFLSFPADIVCSAVVAESSLTTELKTKDERGIKTFRGFVYRVLELARGTPAISRETGIMVTDTVKSLWGTAQHQTWSSGNETGLPAKKTRARPLKLQSSRYVELILIDNLVDHVLCWSLMSLNSVQCLDERWIGKDAKENHLRLKMLLSRYLPTRTEESHEEP